MTIQVQHIRRPLSMPGVSREADASVERNETARCCQNPKCLHVEERFSEQPKEQK